MHIIHDDGSDQHSNIGNSGGISVERNGINHIPVCGDCHKILIIDCHLDNIDRISTLLKSAFPDCGIITAQSGDDGIKEAVTKLPDTIILNINMEEVDGYDICRKLKQNKKTKQIPIIMISSIENNKKSMSLGMKSHLNQESKYRINPPESEPDACFPEPIDDYVLIAQVKLSLRIKRLTDKLILHKSILRKTIREKRIKLRDKEAMFRVLFEQSPNSLVLLDAKTGKILHFNGNACTTLGYTWDEFKNLEMSDIEAADAENKFSERMDNIIARGYDSFETKYVKKDGSILNILFKAKIFFLKEKSFIHSVWIDITERKLAEEQQKKLETQLNQARKMESIGVLAGGVAHDFNNILSIIMGNAQLARMDAGDDKNLKRHLDDILEAGQRGADLTRQLLTFSRKQIISPKIINLNKALETTKKMLGRLIGEDIELVISNDPELWPVLMDPGQVDQIIINVAVNARDAMPRGGKIIFETANKVLDRKYFEVRNLNPEPGRYVLLRIKDSGIGMTRETVQHIFDPFFTTKEKGRGTGLGLSTVYGIVKQNKGFIWVDTKPGIGTSFEIYLPASETQRDKNETATNSMNQSDYEPYETILIAEDDIGLLKIAERILKSKGYTILSAHNGEDALKIAEQYPHSIHLLLSDVVMPKLNGNELAKKIKSLYPEIRVIFMSGYTNDIIDNHGVLKPGLKFIEKPFLSEDLERIVREVLTSDKNK